jgi:hypothetical protein
MRLSRALSVILIASAVSCAAGYSTSSPGGHERPGAIGVSLTLLGGQTLNSLTYNLANGTPADALMGTIPLPTGSASASPYAVPTFEILPVAAATGYTITLSGTSTNGAVTCSGASSPPFAVTAGNETIVNVLVTCTTPNVSGSVEVNATLQNCPTVATLTAINATANTAAPGNTSTIWAAAVGPNPASLTYAFFVTQGAGTVSPASQVTAANDSSSNILFTCPATGETDTIQVVTTDQVGAVCPSSLSTATVTVTCLPPACQGPTVGSGIEASPNTAAGACPIGQTNTGTLQDAQGNFCCSPTPCFGVGTGTEAIPDTAAGICPTGSANTGALTDPLGNFCCSTSAAIDYSVVRVGVVGATQTTDGTATAVFVENHALNLSTSTDTLLGTISLPTAASGVQQPFAYQGISGVGSPNDGALSRSLNGHFLTLGGYAATVGTTNIVAAGSPAVPRVVARISTAGVVDTSTFFPASASYVAAFIRGSVTIDGTAFWTGGSDNATGGIWYIPFGAAGGGTLLNAQSLRSVNIFNGQLYGTADNTATTMMPVLFTAGTGTPTSGPVTETLVPGFPTVATSGADDISAWTFAFVGSNTVYIGSDQAVSAGAPPNGIEKWTLSGGTWSLQTSFNLAAGQLAAGQVGFRGLAVVATGGGTTTLIANTVEPGTPVPANHLAVFVDNGVYGSGGATTTGTIFLQAPANTLYKGVALSPH